MKSGALVRAVSLGLFLSMFGGCAGNPSRMPADANDIQRFEELQPGPGKAYRGSYVDTETDFAFLNQLGIHTLVSFRPLSEDVTPEERLAAAHGIRLVRHPFSANPFEPSEKTIFEALDDIGNPANQPLYFHCALGRDRTGLVAALYRIYYQGWKSGDAHDEWKHFGFAANTGDRLLFSGLERFFDAHLDPVAYWMRHPGLAMIHDFSPRQSCVAFGNARGGLEVFCAVGENWISAATLVHTLAVGGHALAGAAILGGQPDCEHAGGHAESIQPQHGAALGICRFADSSAVTAAAFSGTLGRWAGTHHFAM